MFLLPGLRRPLGIRSPRRRLSPPAQARSRVRASLPWSPSPCALRRPSSRRGPAAPLARGRRCRARPGPARFGSSADPPGLSALFHTPHPRLSRLRYGRIRSVSGDLTAGKISATGGHRLFAPSPRLRAHSLAQTRTTAALLACSQKPSLRRVGLAVCASIAAI